jgi:serine/threonine protein kinase/Flp pilus assembly protein TadD
MGECQSLIGQTVSHYRVLEKIGGGGMGVVYKAEDIKLGRNVALKFLPDEISGNEQLLHRFQREARTTSALNHPHILTVYEIGEDKGTLFIATELVEGRTLRDLLHDALSCDQALAFAKQILEALSSAHRAGVVHRDLKPENIMVRPDGYLKILDFGLAKLLPSPLAGHGENTDVDLTSSGQMLGTVQYMSPEQILGESIDHRSDLFSFAIILYEMVCGRRPWQGTSAVDILHAILHEEPKSISQSTVKDCKNLPQILEKALQKNPSNRYQLADEFLAALSVVAAGGSAAPAAREEDSSSSLAVLPFIFLSDVEGKESLSLGFADALITTLGNLENLVVPPTAAILQYPGGTDPLAVSRAMRVRHVLQGSIQRLGSHWRVSVQLFDSHVGKMIFAEKYDFTIQGVFEIQDEISKRVAEALARKFRRSALKARDRYTTDPGAYGEFLEGLRESYSEDLESLNRAIAALDRAIAADPKFALAHATLSYVCTGKYFGFDPRRTWIDKAEFHCQQGLELDPDLPEAHLAKAFILWSQAANFRHVEAIAEIQKALALQPNLDHAHNRLGTICAHIGRLEDACRAFERARQVNPQNLANHNIAQSYLWGGDLDRAERELDAWARQSPENKYLLWFRPQPALFRGDLESANKYIASALKLLPDEPLMISLNGVLHALRQDSGAAMDCVQRARESPRSFGHTHHTHYQIACTYAVLGQPGKALEWLERTIDEGFACWPLFQRDPCLKTLHEIPEFRGTITRLEREFGQVKIEYI